MANSLLISISLLCPSPQKSTPHVSQNVPSISARRPSCLMSSRALRIKSTNNCPLPLLRKPLHPVLWPWVVLQIIRFCDGLITARSLRCRHISGRWKARSRWRMAASSAAISARVYVDILYICFGVVAMAIQGECVKFG